MTAVAVIVEVDVSNRKSLASLWLDFSSLLDVISSALNTVISSMWYLKSQKSL